MQKQNKVTNFFQSKLVSKFKFCKNLKLIVFYPYELINLHILRFVSVIQSL